MKIEGEEILYSILIKTLKVCEEEILKLDDFEVNFFSNYSEKIKDNKLFHFFRYCFPSSEMI